MLSCHCLLGMSTTALNGWWQETLTHLCHPGCTFTQTRLPPGRLGWDKWSALTSWSSPTMNWMTKAMWVDGIPHSPPLDGALVSISSQTDRNELFWDHNISFLVNQHVHTLFKIKVTFASETMLVAGVSCEAFNRLKLHIAFVLEWKHLFEILWDAKYYTLNMNTC